VAAELHKGRCPALIPGCSLQYQTWAHKISCSVSPPAFGPRICEEEKYLRQGQAGQAQETGVEDEKGERMRPVEDLESLFRRNAWKTKIEGKSMLK